MMFFEICTVVTQLMETFKVELRGSASTGFEMNNLKTKRKRSGIVEFPEATTASTPSRRKKKTPIKMFHRSSDGNAERNKDSERKTSHSTRFLD